jgi:polyhydroxyalkanoate synthesis repressor PhaR
MLRRTMLIKKYGNRRLYDTHASHYITLDQLAEYVKLGAEVTVVDAKSGEDLTQVTLTQIILETRGVGRLLSVPLLNQLISLGDDALADFFGRYVVWALEVYLQTRNNLSSLNPLAGAMLNPLQRMMGGFGLPFGGSYGQEQAPPPPPPPAPRQPASEMGGELAELRRKLEALEKNVGRKKRK